MKKGFEEHIAICGMAMRLPGGIHDDETFWDVLIHGKDTRTPIPANRWNVEGFGPSLGKRGAIKTQHAYFLEDDISCLDASFFTMTKSDLEKVDPQQRQILEVTRECLENAGEVDYRGKPIGCYVGTFGEDWLHSIAREPQTTGFSGSGDLMIANRVSYEFDFKGPSGDCSAAIVAGTSLIMGPYLTGAMTQVGVLSPEGSCKTFDADADGFARAEAINAIYIKRLSDAIKDGNPIRSVIRGILSNSDGKSASLMAPNGESHEELMRNVYAKAGLDPRDTGFVESHGTGTITGDPIEATAIGNVFGERGVLIGSVKPNIGHAEGASGLNSVIKAVLALEHRTIPPNIKFNKPNPKIPFAEKKLIVPVVPTPWPENRAERISVNSFGIGGTNAHAIIDSASEVRSQVLKSAGKTSPAGPKLLGQGAQWPEMGASLIKSDVNFRKDIQEMDKILQSFIHAPSWTIEEELLKSAERSQISKAYLAQPLCTAIQIALVNSLTRCGIQPSAVVGHSSGEIAAATTISGDLDQVRKVVSAVKERSPDVFARQLKVEMAYHSRQRIPESTGFHPSWRVLLDLEDEPWLLDHKVGEDVIFPFAGYVAMAGEAIRQVTGIEAGYSVRHVVAHTAMVLTESAPVEVVTNLTRHKLTDAADSEAYNFTISSYSGSTWIKHCDGLVMPMQKEIKRASHIEPLQRQVRVARWYEIMARVGLVYGPEFQGIKELTSSATEYKAVAEIGNTQSRQEAPFLFHPATIDACLQVVLAALAQAAGRNFTQLCVPTLIEELDVSRSAATMVAEAWSLDDKVGLDCVADGKVALRLRGARLSPLDEEKSNVDIDRHAAARLEWYPDIDFMEIPPLFAPPMADNDVKRLLEELALLCLLDSHERLQGLHTEQPHFLQFRDWLAREKERAKSGDYPVVQNASSYLDLSRAQRVQGMKDRMNILHTNESIGLVATGIMRICENAEGLFTGSVDTLDLLMKDNVLTEIYNAVSFGFGDFIHMLSLTKPNLRILEVGAGTGGTTELILRDLARAGGNPAYSTYCFTDISAGFFAQAKERFSYAPNMDYQVFDISKDPFEQGFKAQSFDIILAPNVVHATANLNQTLKNLQPLLRPHGHLVLSEVCALARAPGYVFGNFSGWWLGEADNRKWEPYIMPERWDMELKAAGFTGTDVVVYDAEAPFQYCAAIVSQPQPQEAVTERPVVILCRNPKEGITLRLVQELENCGVQVTTTAFGDMLPHNSDIISTLDLEGRFFEDIAKADFIAFQEILRQYEDQKMLWLMPPTQVACENPRSGQTIGTFRVARAELAIPIHTLEIDESESEFATLVMKVFQKVRTREDNDIIAPDKEYAVDKGVIKIGRYQPFSLEEEVGEKGCASSGNAQTLVIGKPGLLDTLAWVEESISDVGDNQVEIEVRAVGLNFRDIMVAMGVLKFGSKSVSLGLELTGVVSKVGADVKNVVVGDHVCGVAMEGCFSTRAILLSSLVVRIPDSLGFEEGATMPACYTTAVQALLDVGQMKSGQTVLIHSACGGIGHAAIDLCKMVGAEIYCTVGNEDKANYLVEKLNIPRERIFDSRNDSFLAGVLDATGGQGVDIVLNSLSGELLHASWRCVAEFGKLIELGKRDLVGYGKLDLEPFLANRSYCCVDLAHAMKKRPETVGATIERWVSMFSQGLITPIPMTVFDAKDISSSFRHLQKGDHIGKAVIRIPAQISDIPSKPKGKVFSLNPDASYLLTGGLGGLGRSVATWMVERGARNLIFLSRSAGQGEHDSSFLSELESMGCKITAIQGKADDIQAVQEVASRATKPVKGIFHLAMVLRDAPILDMTYEDWTEAVVPKVEGAWNLHNTFKDEELDFFVMTSSLVTLIDQPGQGNYAAANTFLESFVQYRHRLGLPASVLGVCPVDDIGFVAENPLIRRKLKSQGLYFLPERELLEYMELAILNSHPPKTKAESTSNDNISSWKSSGHIVMGLRSEVHLNHPDCQTSWRRDRRMGMFHNISEDTKGDSSTLNSNALKSFLARAALDPEILGVTANAEYLADEIGARIFRFMMKEEEDIDTSMTLNQIGMDSLMAIELRRWWKQTFGAKSNIIRTLSFPPLFIRRIGVALMWLINTSTLKLEFFGDPENQKYAILSHTWEHEEVSFQDMIDLDKARSKAGFSKIDRTCELARSSGLKYAWVDTCCIDKSSSAELSEAINSMFEWYKLSKICYVYLSDLSEMSNVEADLPNCKWFTRGWTLQELIAPADIEFYNASWELKGSKTDLQEELSGITGIDVDILEDSELLSTACVARRIVLPFPMSSVSSVA
ncbi:putative Phthiocerol synthesis polyketide synthase type I PpsC [Glarea lozoyensis 74030]|uniref:Putative Phthiocerol synthesis polyketide synthase type I PpsC n=1 Tax=Glarea lozoyensis (strain ATCC 74030 / MF5533) TaxID=1104152 RepID=H0EWB4_GLAL7|nr:putative Phthiocerol synthesis polyketide synthase type I PpsC [Glarea lozoyensis 74030]